jgi:tetratricopeptide (TPR) repeat protein
MQGLRSDPDPGSAATRSFRTGDVARILGVPPARVRRIVRAGLCRPRPHHGRRWAFSFQDLVLLRAAHGLLLAAVPPRRVRRALAQLTQQLAPNRPLSGVRIYADGQHVVAREGRTVWRPESGQVVFTFEVDELARAAAVVVPVRAPHRRDAATASQRRYDAATWFERALALERRKDPAAVAAYHRAIELDPDMGDAYINLGRLVYLRGDVAEATRLYHLALACAPDDPVAHYNLAITLEDQQRTTSALSHYRRAISLDPSFADAHFNLGRLLERLGQKTQAMRHLLTYKKLTQ